MTEELSASQVNVTKGRGCRMTRDPIDVRLALKRYRGMQLSLVECLTRRLCQTTKGAAGGHATSRGRRAGGGRRKEESEGDLDD